MMIPITLSCSPIPTTAASTTPAWMAWPMHISVPTISTGASWRIAATTGSMPLAIICHIRIRRSTAHIQEIVDVTMRRVFLAAPTTITGTISISAATCQNCRVVEHMERHRRHLTPKFLLNQQLQRRQPCPSHPFSQSTLHPSIRKAYAKPQLAKWHISHIPEIVTSSLTVVQQLRCSHVPSAYTGIAAPSLVAHPKLIVSPTTFQMLYIYTMQNRLEYLWLIYIYKRLIDEWQNGKGIYHKFLTRKIQ